MKELTWKTSTVYVAIGGDTKVYRTVEEMPFTLRRQLAEKTRGWNSASIVIADQRGWDLLVRAMRGNGPQRQANSAAAGGLIAEAEAAPFRMHREASGQSAVWRRIREIVILAIVALAVWLAFFGR